ncbi:MAG: hypothetical protein M1825_001164 [Sarcosagium campestre]|nr:MAG: hypothetical protein M1825_001164 [Sarcosagium campestre]
MHFAFPPRKTSHPPPYANRSSRNPLLRRSQLQLAAFVAGVILIIIYIFARSSGSARIPSGTPPVVIVTPFDDHAHSKEHINRVKDNRLDYAKRHGYETFFPSVRDYDLYNAPLSWARVPAVRHAMTLYPHSTYFFHLDQNALIMNPSLSIESHVMDRWRLESIMLRNHAVVPPDSVIKTFSHLRGDQIDLVLTQDHDGISPGSFIVRQGEYSQFFLDTWFDPLFRSYNFQKAEGHGLEHVIQWHPTILARLALIPQKVMNSYSLDTSKDGKGTGLFEDRDFVIHFAGCAIDTKRNCEKELLDFYNVWESHDKKKT